MVVKTCLIVYIYLLLKTVHSPNFTVQIKTVHRFSYNLVLTAVILIPDSTFLLLTS